MCRLFFPCIRYICHFIMWKITCCTNASITLRQGYVTFTPQWPLWSQVETWDQTTGYFPRLSLLISQHSEWLELDHKKTSLYLVWLIMNIREEKLSRRSSSYLNRPSAIRSSYIVFSAGLMRDFITWRAPLLPSLLPRTIHEFSMHTA